MPKRNYHRNDSGLFLPDDSIVTPGRARERHSVAAERGMSRRRCCCGVSAPSCAWAYVFDEPYNCYGSYGDFTAYGWVLYYEASLGCWNLGMAPSPILDLGSGLGCDRCAVTPESVSAIITVGDQPASCTDCSTKTGTYILTYRNWSYGSPTWDFRNYTAGCAWDETAFTAWDNLPCVATSCYVTAL